MVIAETNIEISLIVVAAEYLLGLEHPICLAKPSGGTPPFVVKPSVVEGLFGFVSAESVSAGGEAVAAAELVVAEAEAEPVLAFTGGTSDGAVLAGVLMLGLGFGSLAVQRCRRNSTFF
ncbi:hypothetical protein OAC41_06095 [Acidimicrobiales bacterium]|nr:hypothetical protein [Acidimicrobiales bacterium]MDC0350026.1 hypothetical protein [bacterium]